MQHFETGMLVRVKGNSSNIKFVVTFVDNTNNWVLVTWFSTIQEKFMTDKVCMAALEILP